MVPLSMTPAVLCRRALPVRRTDPSSRMSPLLVMSLPSSITPAVACSDFSAEVAPSGPPRAIPVKPDSVSARLTPLLSTAPLRLILPWVLVRLRSASNRNGPLNAMSLPAFTLPASRVPPSAVTRSACNGVIAPIAPANVALCEVVTAN
ncbi:hypothetical protein D3C81_1491660 [compost metagenome]